MVDAPGLALLLERLATLGGLGATTYGSEVAIGAGVALWRLARLWLGPRLWLVMVVIALLVAMPITGSMEQAHGKDPGHVVLDESVGAAPVALAPGWAIGFLLTAIIYGQFDHFKPLGIGYLEALPGGIGIVLDDLGAALWALVLVASGSRAVWALWGRSSSGLHQGRRS